MTDAIKVLVADDHAVVRYGLRSLIASEPGMEVIGEAADGVEALALAQRLLPDVLVLDLLMPRKDGRAVIAELANTAASVRVLVLTSYAEDDMLFPAIKAGALGYLLKESAPQELLAAIRDVARGEAALHPVVARRILREFGGAFARPLAEALSDREAEVLGLVARGLPNQEIADCLGLSERTVRSHVSAILAKLHLGSRTQAALYALRTGLAELERAP